MKELRKIPEKSEAILEALGVLGRRTKGSEILGYFEDFKMYIWISYTVEPWREQKAEGRVRSINLHIKKHLKKKVLTEVFGNESLHTLVEQK